MLILIFSNNQHQQNCCRLQSNNVVSQPFRLAVPLMLNNCGRLRFSRRVSRLNRVTRRADGITPVSQGLVHQPGCREGRDRESAQSSHHPSITPGGNCCKPLFFKEN